MVTVECPWCTGPAHVDRSTQADMACDTCAIVVEIAPDPIREPLDRAA